MRLGVGLGLAVLVLAADQLSKYWILHGIDLPDRGQVAVIPGYLDLAMVWNHGVTFGLFQAGNGIGQIVLAGIAIAVVIGLFVWLRRAESLLVAACIGAIAGGALGNVADRFRVGMVVDFIHVHWGAHDPFPFVFNIGDSAIVIGVAALLLDSVGAGGLARPGRALAGAATESVGSQIMRPFQLRVSALFVPLVLGACSSDVERTFGLTRDAPDEFTVTTRAPLSQPPEYTLAPPHPGAARPQELTTQQAAEAALAPDTALGTPGGPETAGQQALVQQAGPAAPADIRDKINAEQQLDRPREGLTEQLMFWKSTPEPGTPLDPARESQRLRENAALGQPPTVGDTPIIQQKKSGGGFLGIF